MTQCQPMSGQEILEAFLASPPLISQQILDLSVQHPSFLRDIFETQEWPRGHGTIMQQLIFRGAMPEIERGFDKWKKLNNNTGCDVSCSPDCGYNWTQFGGHGFDRRAVELMAREFRSPSYCIAEIQTTLDFEEVFAKIVENLYRQVDFFKELNVGQNVLTGLAKKFVVDSGGPKANTQNPYVYRPLGSARLSRLNMDMLEFFYEWMTKILDCVPYDVIDGAPVFSIMASRQTLGRLYRDDPTLRQDVRFSGAANALLTKYNFMSTIRGMFIAAPIMYPRRFDSVAGVWTERLPFVNGIPADTGAYTGFNPEYELARYEEVILNGKYPFKIFTLPTEQSLGQNTTFGPEYDWFNSWQWINPQTVQDPFRRVGYFATSAKIGVAQQFSEGLFSVLVERVDVRSTAVFNPEPECPPDPVTCDNEVPAVTCPCPLVLSVTPNPVTPGNYFIQFSVPTTAVAQETLQIGLDTGGYLTGTVVSVSADGFTAEVTFTTTCPSCVHFTSIYCNDTLGCSAEVLSACACATASGSALTLTLKNPIKANAEDDITVYFCDGTSTTATVVSASLCSNTYVVTLGVEAGECTDNNNIVTVCVPPETDASCPACGGGPTITYCAS